MSTFTGQNHGFDIFARFRVTWIPSPLRKDSFAAAAAATTLVQGRGDVGGDREGTKEGRKGAQSPQSWRCC